MKTLMDDKVTWKLLLSSCWYKIYSLHGLFHFEKRHQPPESFMRTIENW